MPKLYPGNKPSYGNGKPSLFIFLAIAFPCFLFAQPVITSFSPASGPIGIPVTITGSGFNTTPASNIVFFGTGKAAVSAATATSLTVTVPAGTSYQPITVTTGGLTASSAQPFITTFTDPGQFTADAFSQRTTPDIPTNPGPQVVTSADLDGDGRPDMIVANSDDNSISVYMNTSTPGAVSFTLTISHPMHTTPDYPVGIAAGDLDGDGKPEIVVTNANSGSIAIFHNTSTIGNISLDLTNPVYYNASANTSPIAVTIGDLNGDGKPEIITACPGNDVASTYNTLTIYKNNSTAGSLSFATGQDLVLPTGSYPAGVVIGDFDGDGKPDLATENYYTALVSVFRNTGTAGAITFATNTDFPTGIQPFGLASADMDGDGKPDLVVANQFDNTVTLLRNTTTGTTLNFDPGSATPITGNSPQGIGIADMDGDGKPDLAIANAVDATIFVYRNTSTAGTIALTPGVSYPTGSFPQFLTIADWDVDGKPDLATSNYGGTGSISVLRNHAASEPNITSFTPLAATTGATVTIDGNNFTGATGVSFGGTPATSFVVVSNTQITAVIAAGASGAVIVTTPSGVGSLNGFTFNQPPPSVHSFTPSTGPGGTKVSVVGTGFTSTSVVTFGGTVAGSYQIVNDTLLYAFVGTGSSGKIAVFNPYGADSAGVFTFIDTTAPPPPPPGPPDITSFSPSGGPTGTVITIKGTNLLLTEDVRFGGTPAHSFNATSDTTIVAVVGTGSTGQVSVTSPNGTDALPGFTFVQPVSLVYAITSFAPASGNKGAAITIQGSHFTGATAVSFGGTSAAAYTVTSDSTIIAIIGSGATGQIKVASPSWQDSLAGFTFIQDSTHSGSGGSSTQVNVFQLLQFSGQVSGDQSILNWTARNDKNIFFYVVERGTDSTAFSVLTSIEPDLKDAGNHIYTYTDPSPRAGTNYYRLKMVDTSGSFIYSKTISLQAKGKTDRLSVFPNPVKYGFTVVDVPVTSRPSYIRITDISGQVIKSQNINANNPQVRIDLPGLIKGTYKMVWTDGVNYSWATILILQ